MQYHLPLTERCNRHCKYCGGTRHLRGLHLDPVYTIDQLENFVFKDPEAVIGFYGGEPTLAIPRMEMVMERVLARAFTLQTNGYHLSEIPDDHLHRLDAILISVDGGREVTDTNRGPGAYDAAMGNLREIEERGYRGDVIVRMAVSHKADIYSDATHLLELRDPSFDHVHWQFDVFWSNLNDWDDLEGWLTRYDKGITKLTGYFSDRIKDGEVLGIVPFIPVLKTLITGEAVPGIRCGAGDTSFAIMT